MQFSTGGSLCGQVEIMKPSDTVVSTSTHWRCGGFRPGVRHSENTAAFPENPIGPKTKVADSNDQVLTIGLDMVQKAPFFCRQARGAPVPRSQRPS